MKLFQSELKDLENLGFSPNQSRLNRKVVAAFICYWLGVISDCIFVVFEVNSFSEMAYSIFFITSSVAVSACFTILIFNSTKMFDFVKNYEQFVDIGKI